MVFMTILVLALYFYTVFFQTLFSFALLVLNNLNSELKPTDVSQGSVIISAKMNVVNIGGD